MILEKVEKAWRSAEWTDTRSVFEYTNVARLFLEREDTQAPHEESVKGHDILANMPFSLSHEMHDFPDRSGTSLQPPVGHTRRGGAPEHQRSEAASLPRASSPRVVSCPTSGAGQMRDSELFV